MEKYLIVEEDPDRGVILLQYLKDHVDVHLSAPTPQFIGLVEKLRPAVVIFSMNSVNRMKFYIEELREHFSFFNIGIICITAKNSSFEKKELYEFGADAVYNQPFQLEDIYWSAFSILRRKSQHKLTTSDKILIGPYKLNPETNEIEYNNIKHKIQPIHTKLLSVFTNYPNRLLKREWLKEHVWNSKVSNRSIDAQISKLKKQFEQLDVFIESVYGQGYIYNPDKKKIAS